MSVVNMWWRFVMVIGLVVCAAGCASVTMVNPEVMETGDVRATAEVDAAAAGAAAKYAAQLGVGLYKGLELDVGAGVVPSVQERPYAEEDRLKSTFFTAGTAFGFELDQAGEKVPLKLGLDVHREVASYEATSLTFGSWGLLSPGTSESWIDRVTWRYRLHGSVGVKPVSWMMLYAGGAIVLSTHDVVKYDETYESNEGEDVVVSGYRSEAAFESYVIIDGIAGLYIPFGESNFGLQFEGSFTLPPLVLPHASWAEGDPLYSPFRDIAQVNLGLVWTIDAIHKPRPPASAGGLGEEVIP